MNVDLDTSSVVHNQHILRDNFKKIQDAFDESGEGQRFGLEDALGAEGREFDTDVNKFKIKGHQPGDTGEIEVNIDPENIQITLTSKIPDDSEVSIIGTNSTSIGLSHISTSNGNNEIFLGPNNILLNAASAVKASSPRSIIYDGGVPAGGEAAGDYDDKAVLKLQSVTRGFLPSRLTTTQRNAISSVPEGLVIYNLTTHKLECYDGTTWQAAW